MDRMNSEVFSPIRNLDEEKIKRRSDSFSKFLKGPDVFKKNLVNSESLENVDEDTIAKLSASKKLIKTYQKKSAKSKTLKSEGDLPSYAHVHDNAFTASSEESSSLKIDKLENLSVTSKKSKDLKFLDKRNDKIETSQRNEIEGNHKGKNSHSSAKQKSKNCVKSSLRSRAVVVPKAGSEEIKKTDKLPSVNQRNPSSQIQSGALEKIINDAVESKVDGIQQLLWSHYADLLKTIYIFKEEMEQKHASENSAMFKIIEELLEENRLLRNAILARQ